MLVVVEIIAQQQYFKSGDDDNDHFKFSCIMLMLCLTNLFNRFNRL